MHKGFTIIETVLTVAVLALVVSLSTPAYRNFIVKYQLNVSARDSQQLIRTAQVLSMATRDDDQYGVHYTTGSGGTIILFKGASYASRDLTYDELTYTLPNSLSLSSTISGSDVVFLKREGSTSNIGTLTLTSTDGDFRDLIVNSVGMVDVN